MALKIDSIQQLRLDSLAQVQADSLARARQDSIMRENLSYGLVFANPYEEVKEVESTSTFSNGMGMSCVVGVLVLLFCAVCIRFQGNSRYFGALMMDMHDTRRRNNMFDDTVRESSFLLLLNLLWIFSSGVLLWQAVLYAPQYLHVSIPPIADRGAMGVMICTGLTLLYEVLMSLAYITVGNVFFDRESCGLWLRGFYSTQGMSGALLLPLALLTIWYPEWMHILLIISIFVFIWGKILFIFKGFRIFFQQIASILSFLYYLCSLEIVPIILTYYAALQLSQIWL